MMMPGPPVMVPGQPMVMNVAQPGQPGMMPPPGHPGMMPPPGQPMMMPPPG